MSPNSLPHDAYATAVMAALDAEGLVNANDSWTEYASDNGVVMLMELVVSLDGDRAREAGWGHGLTLLWNQVDGWQWGPDTQGGRLQYTRPLVSRVVPQPADIVRAATALLDGEAGVLPIAGTPSGVAEAVPPAIQALLDEEIEPGDVDDAPTEETLRQLAAYATA
jgi:hypothetical protein